MEMEELQLFDLAFLLRMPVYKMLEEMPYTELLGWQEYFDKRPFGWQDDARTYMLLKAFGCEARAEDLFPSLKALNKGEKSIGESLAKSNVASWLASAVGGDNVGLFDKS